MVLFKSRNFTVDLPDGRQWVCVSCNALPDFKEFKEGLMNALDYVRTGRLNFWLFDLRAIDELKEEEETWLQVQFFPQLMMLGRENYIALVVSEACYERMLQEVGAYGLKSYNSFIIIDTFCHVPEAEAWLRFHQSNPVE
ncbi:hypothetical protein [Pontibacter fetidus]|uniref:STAS/SEC14 domain-containing protein n=1 Tax=Pontibacter fetidus TaxID=2700082 RepID=A0A6B2GZK0_9BACT|nr:hypothetical protein [Pontibacter fetidus]NDK55463.1 hypothetical protein [Pontibacter fetidus]